MEGVRVEGGALGDEDSGGLDRKRDQQHGGINLDGHAYHDGRARVVFGAPVMDVTCTPEYHHCK